MPIDQEELGLAWIVGSERVDRSSFSANAEETHR